MVCPHRPPTARQRPYGHLIIAEEKSSTAPYVRTPERICSRFCRKTVLKDLFLPYNFRRDPPLGTARQLQRRFARFFDYKKRTETARAQRISTSSSARRALSAANFSRKSIAKRLVNRRSRRRPFNRPYLPNRLDYSAQLRRQHPYDSAAPAARNSACALACVAP